MINFYFPREQVDVLCFWALTPLEFTEALFLVWPILCSRRYLST